MAATPSNIEPLKTPVDTVLIMYTGSADNLTEKEVLHVLPELQRICIYVDVRPDINYKYGFINYFLKLHK